MSDWTEVQYDTLRVEEEEQRILNEEARAHLDNIEGPPVKELFDKHGTISSTEEFGFGPFSLNLQNERGEYVLVHFPAGTMVVRSTYRSGHRGAGASKEIKLHITDDDCNFHFGFRDESV